MARRWAGAAACHDATVGSLPEINFSGDGFERRRARIGLGMVLAIMVVGDMAITCALCLTARVGRGGLCA